MLNHRGTIPLCRPRLDETEFESVRKVLESGWVTQGPVAEEFERRLSEYIGVDHSILVSNCTSALFLALVVSGIGAGDEVILPSFTFVATANAVKHAGAIPVFCDIEQTTYNIDPLDIEKRITAKTRAILPVHQMGLPAEMDTVDALATQHHLTVIEDAACAMGSEYHGRKIGQAGNVCCFSFHPRKIITTGEGGLVTTDRRPVADMLRSLRSHGEILSDTERHSRKDAFFIAYAHHGYNFRMTDIQAVIGLCQLRKLDGFIDRRRRLAKQYTDIFSNASRIQTPVEPDGIKHTYQSYCIRLRDSDKTKRDRLVGVLRRKGILCTPGIQAVHRQKLFQARGALPVTERCADTTVILPLDPGMKAGDVAYIAETLLRSL